MYIAQIIILVWNFFKAVMLGFYLDFIGEAPHGEYKDH